MSQGQVKQLEDEAAELRYKVSEQDKLLKVWIVFSGHGQGVNTKVGWPPGVGPECP